MLWNYLNFVVALLELHWIYNLTKFGCWMRLPCHRELFEYEPKIAPLALMRGADS